MPTGATLAGVTLLNASEIGWEVSVGEQPFTTTVVVAASEAQRVRGLMGRPTSLVARGEEGGFTAAGVYVVDESPTTDPSMTAFVVADKRWLWTRRHVLRRYNVRRRTGNRRLLTEGFPVEIPGDVADVGFESATLIDGVTPWTARDAVLDVVTVVDGEEPDTSGLPLRQVPIEGVEIDDDGAAAIGRILDYMPGAAVYVGIDGRTRFLDETARTGAENLLRRFGAPVAGAGLAATVDYAAIRPAWVDVLFTIEQELKFTSREEGGAYATRGDKSKYLENVLPVPDLTLAVGGRTVTRGTYITFDEAFTAWGIPQFAGAGPAVPGSAPPALSHSIVRQLWMGGRLEALYAEVGKLVPDADWAARVRAVRQHYRQTYRISPYWMARIRSLSAERVAVIDPENGVRAPAFVTADYAYQPGVRGRWIDRNKQGIVINVRAFSENLATAKQAPADVSIVDGQLGILHLSYSTDALGVWEEVWPCRFEDPIPQADFGRGVQSAVTTDGAVYEGAAPAILSASHRVAVVITAVPSAPNSNDQLFRVRVTPTDATKVGPPVAASSGPGWAVRVGPGVATARFAWSDAQDGLIDKMFGAGPIAPKRGQQPTYEAGDGLKGAGLLVDGRELDNVARAVAASLYSQMPDRVVGQVAGPMDPGISPVGNATAVVHSLGTDGALNSLVRFDRRTGRLDMTSFLDNSTRRLLFRQVQA